MIQTALVLGYAIYRQVDLTSLQTFILHDQAAIFVTAISLLPTHLLTLGLIWLIVTRAGKYPFWETIGWKWTPGFNFWTCAGLAIVLLGVGMAITFIMHDQPTPLDDMIKRSAAGRYTIALLATFTAPLTEEFVYRGVLYSAIQRFTGKAWAVAIVLLMFTLVHVPQYWPSFGVILTIAILSFFLTAIRSYTGSILPCVVIHTVFNGIQSLLIVLEPWINKWFHLTPEVKTVPDPQGFVAAVLSLFHHLKI